MEDMKSISELSDIEAKEILAFVFPDNKEYSYEGMPILPNALRYIKYHNGEHDCMLPFEDTRVVLWLYRHGYDVGVLLESNSYMSEMEGDFENFAFELSALLKSEHSMNLKDKCKAVLDKYYYKNFYYGR